MGILAALIEQKDNYLSCREDMPNHRVQKSVFLHSLKIIFKKDNLVRLTANETHARRNTLK
jgi:hypothetical protein